MNEEGHRERARQLRDSQRRLRPVEDISLYTEASFGIAYHLLMAGAQQKFGVHEERHEGLARWPREREETAMAEHLIELEDMRSGGWYGRKGNGSAAQRQDELLDAIEQWSVA